MQDRYSVPRTQSPPSRRHGRRQSKHESAPLPKSKNRKKARRRTAQQRRTSPGSRAGTQVDLGDAAIVSAPAPAATQATPLSSPPPTDAADDVGAVPDDEDLPAWAANVLREFLVVSYWFDSGEGDRPYDTSICFSGRRCGLDGTPGPGDAFTQEETVSGIVPGSGPVAVSAEFHDINPGEWVVAAQPVTRPGTRTVRPWRPAVDGHPTDTRPRIWPRRVTVPDHAPERVRTTSVLAVRKPGIVRIIWSALVVTGMLVGLGLQAALLAGAHRSAGSAVALSVLAIAGGLVGAKIWYVVKQRRFDGWCIQGFIAGAGIVTGALLFAGFAGPPGAYLDTAAPALLLGMAIGRPGCFWAGCCTGRPTGSRLGIWSSDRRLGTRRVPVQLLEALLALLIGVGALVAVLLAGVDSQGLVLGGAVSAFTLGRQFLLGLRTEPPRWPHLAGVVTVAAATALVADIVAAALL